MKISFLFAWYDLWIGLFWDSKKKWLYILPIPCLGIIFKFDGLILPKEYWINDTFSTEQYPYNLWHNDFQIGGFKTMKEAIKFAIWNELQLKNENH